MVRSIGGGDAWHYVLRAIANSDFGLRNSFRFRCVAIAEAFRTEYFPLVRHTPAVENYRSLRSIVRLLASRDWEREPSLPVSGRSIRDGIQRPVTTPSETSQST